MPRLPEFRLDTHVERAPVDDSGVLLLPGAIYASDLGATPTNHVRLGIEHLGTDEGLAALDAHVLRNRS